MPYQLSGPIAITCYGQILLSVEATLARSVSRFTQLKSEKILIFKIIERFCAIRLTDFLGHWQISDLRSEVVIIGQISDLETTRSQDLAEIWSRFDLNLGPRCVKGTL